MAYVVGILIGLVAGAAAVWLVLVSFTGSKLAAARRTRQLMLTEARNEADAVRREADLESKESAVKYRADVERELQSQRADALRERERLHSREDELNRRVVEIERREQGVADRETHVKQLQEEFKDAKDREVAELERISSLTMGEAKSEILFRSEELVRHELARRVRQLEEEAQTDARRRARNLVADSLQRVAASHAAETTVSIVELPSDDMKGRIIGREGRNIRALEHLTGVDFIIDDTPQAVVLSSFDGMRREIAKLTLQKLLEDGRIHPATDRGDVLPVQGRGRRPRPAGRRAGRVRGALRRVPRGAREDPRPPQVPDELRAERAQAHARGRPPGRDHGQRARREREDRETCRAAARSRQGADARGGGLARADLGPVRASATASRTASCTRSRRTTTRCSRRRSRRCS